MPRRQFLGVAAAGAATGAAFAQRDDNAAPTDHAAHAQKVRAGKIKQSVCRWCYGGMELDALCAMTARLGLASVELLGPGEWDAPKKHGLTCALATNVPSNPIPKGFNREANHAAILTDLEQRLPLVKSAGVPLQIVFSGNRAGQSDAEGLKNCAAGLKKITPLAEDLGVTLVMELLNSKVDHKDYQCDRTAWGAALVGEVGSPCCKLLYDIYHMQIMEGDVIRTIMEHFDAIAHFHTGGVPGRGVLDDAQELNYQGICKALAARNYAGYLGQEFIPGGDAEAELRTSALACTV